MKVAIWESDSVIKIKLKYLDSLGHESQWVNFKIH